MKTTEVARLSPPDRFVYWVKERHQIYLKRRAGLPPPWTDDEVLRSYFFTNPYRENDKVTQWFRENIRDPLRDDPAVLFATIAFRWFNWPPTAESLMSFTVGKPTHPFGMFGRWDTEQAVRVLTALKEGDNQIFTGAFNISNSGSTKPKVNRVCEDYIQPAWEARHQLAEVAWDSTVTMQGMHAGLMTLPGMGGSGFMAYEVVCDLRYTYLLENATDKLVWSNPGPGAKRGLNRLLGRPLEAKVSTKEWLAESAKLLHYLSSKLPRMPPFEMREVEHSMCEWDKYERARCGDGHMKRRYNGG